MTKNDRDQRNKYILDDWRSGRYTVKQLAGKWELSTESIYQILRSVGAKVERKLTGRSYYLGTTVTKETSEKIKELAQKEGLSTSQYLCDLITSFVEK